MRWDLKSKLVTVCVAGLILLLAVFCIRPLLEESSHDDPRVTTTRSVSRDHLESIQSQLKTARELDAQMRVTIYYQGPVPIRIARRKPEFLFFHKDSFGDAPAEWYWYENQQLCVYEEWRARGGRGVCVTNILEIAEGSAERAFELVLSKSENLAQYGYVGLGLLRLAQEAPAAQLKISETDTAWQLTGAADVFDSKVIERFLSGTEDRTFVVFELSRPARVMPRIASIRVGLESVSTEPGTAIPPAAGTIAEFDSLQFLLDREQFRFPKPPTNAIKNIKLKDVDAIDVGIMNRLPLIPTTE